MVKLRIIVDDRESSSGLADLLGRRWQPTASGRLVVGDVHIGERVVVERKTIADFVASLEDGRLFRQAKAVTTASRHPLLILEGEDAVELSVLYPDSLRGVLLTLLVGFRLPILRTSGIEETAAFLIQLAAQEQRRSLQPKRDVPEPPKARIAMEMLGVIPGMGDLRARKLMDRFGTLRGVLDAKADELTEIDGIGPRTAKSLRELGGPGNAGESPDRPPGGR